MAKAKKGLDSSTLKLDITVEWSLLFKWLKKIKDLTFKYVIGNGIAPIQNRSQAFAYVTGNTYHKVDSLWEKFTECYKAVDEMSRNILLMINPNSSDYVVEVRNKDNKLLSKYWTSKKLIEYKAR